MSQTICQTCWPLDAKLCYTGHAGCLCYLLEHGCPLEDNVLMCAVAKGHFDCVELLVTWELPQKPMTFHNSRLLLESLPIGPDQLRCIQYVSDHDCPIHTDVLYGRPKVGTWISCGFGTAEGWVFGPARMSKSHSMRLRHASCTLTCGYTKSGL
jgi:hypothetical protein